MTISQPAGAGTAEMIANDVFMGSLKPPEKLGGEVTLSMEKLRDNIIAAIRARDKAHAAAIADAITAAESGAMERCAKIAETAAITYSFDGIDRNGWINQGIRQASDQIAYAIRSSISPQGTEE